MNYGMKLLALVLLMLYCALTAQAQTFSRDDPHENENPNVEEYVWSEGDVQLPDYPVDDNLYEFQVDQPAERFRYFIDKSSIQFGSNDVVLYTLVVRSNTGGENVMFEGARCSTNEYKTYAFGNGQGGFRKARKLVWRSVDGRTANLFRLAIVRDYLCNPHLVNKTADKIVDQIRYNDRNIREEGWK